MPRLLASAAALVPAIASGPALAADGATAFLPVQTPERAIVFDSGHAGGAQIFAVRPDGSGLVQLTSASAAGVFGRVPDFSPDCSQIAFQSNHDEPDVRSIYVMNADGSRVRRLTHGPEHAEASAWLPHGSAARRLMFDGETDRHPDWCPAPVSQSLARREMVRRYVDFADHVIGGGVEPHWLADGDDFWFVARGRESETAWRVDPEADLVEPYTPPRKPAPAAVPSSLLSPDGRARISTRDHNLWLHLAGQTEMRLTDDGTELFSWDLEAWPPPAAAFSPDGSRLAARRADLRDSPRVPVVHYDEPRERVTWAPWLPPGGSPSELVVFAIPEGDRRVVSLPADGSDAYIYGWHPDSRRLYVITLDQPYYLQARLYEVHADTGEVRQLLAERAQQGYLWDHPERESLFTLLPERGQFVWKSLRDGWSQLYLYDLEGREIRRLTHGDFPVERVVMADEQRAWLYFVARADPERIYDTHLYRVGLDGGAPEQLTEEPGQHDAHFLNDPLHTIRFSPSGRFFLDTHSSPSRPPRTDLRRADGTLVRTISEADVSALENLRWNPPEEFTVVAADGVTELHGLLYKPWDFDPGRRYPVINYVYGSGASFTTVPRTFVPHSFGRTAQALAQLGAVVVMVDARGGAGRSKAFRDAAYGDVGSVEIADQIAALRQLAEVRPYLDLARVGITGDSFGGYMTVRGMLAAPEFYSVGVARAPISTLADHYNRIYVGPWSEARQGAGEAIPPADNVVLAQRLAGKLLIIHGTADLAVPLGQTMRLLDAFIRADRPFDLLLMPGETHGSSEIWDGYGWEALLDYFDEHLIGENR